MQSAAVPGSSRFRSRFLVLLGAAACGSALAGSGCGSYSSPKDAGSDASSAGGRGGTTSGLGGMGVGGATPGVGGMGAGGTAGAGVGGAAGTSAGGAAGSTDAGTDMIVNLCGDAGPDASMGDQDNDGVIDCLDACPDDYFKQTSPGMCGCGVPDTDTDNDGWPDCMDECPKEPNSHVPGICGCGVPDSTPLCLVHRYTFDDTTRTIADSIRNLAGVTPADGTLMGTGALPTGGHVVLRGGLSTQIGGDYVSLPANIISRLGNTVTIEAWVTWSPVTGQTDGAWQRIFDFGSSDQAAGMPGNGQTYLFLSPLNGGTRVVRTAITIAGNGSESLVDAPGSLPTNTALPVHLAVVVNGATSQLSLYIEGVQSGPTATLSDPALVAKLNDVNNWIGRSQFVGDQLYAGSIYEFRIYGKALTAADIAASHTAGPDVLPAPSDGGVTDGGAGAGGNAGTGGAAGAPGDASAG